MAGTVVLEEMLEIPLDLQSLADFRRWANSDDFPEHGRIDFLAGRIEVDMSPEDFFCHGTLKVELVRVLSQHVKDAGSGHLVTDRTRISSPEADLSAEPDVVFVSQESLDTGRARLVSAAGGRPGRYVELEGAPDLVVEIVSDRSAVKDTQRLPRAYFKAGIREFWLVDARTEPLVFLIHQPGQAGYQAVEADSEGFQRSAVLACRFRLDGRRDAQGRWTFDLRKRP
ncbi:MAG TPA: Uma2 family endonuclease [Thermoguttaceae bacterium]|nr:Uma2 family endonuclease [Thermoguttaceae bacterium]